jgi:hypothetical protein
MLFREVTSSSMWTNDEFKNYILKAYYERISNDMKNCLHSGHCSTADHPLRGCVQYRTVNADKGG